MTHGCLPDYSSEQNPNCPQGYGNCSCECHRWEGVSHCIPCCYPSDDEYAWGDDILGELRP